MKDRVFFKFNTILDDGAELVILQGGNKIQIDLTFEAFKDLLWESSNTLDKYPEIKRRSLPIIS